MNLKPLIIFLVIAYFGYLVGGYVVDYLAPILPSVFTGIIGEALRFVIPTAIVFYGYLKLGKKG